jgi:hypothetical protein
MIAFNFSPSSIVFRATCILFTIVINGRCSA